MAQPQPPSLSEELARVTGDQVPDLRVLSQAQWFVFNPAAVNTTAVTADPIGYVAFGTQYFGVSVDWNAVSLWESTADQLDGIAPGLLAGVRGAEDVRTLDALFDAVTTLTNYLEARTPLFQSWVESTRADNPGLGGSALELIVSTLDSYATRLETLRASLKTRSGVPLATAIDNARALLRQFNSDVAGSWADAQAQGLRGLIRQGIETAIAAVQNHLVAGGIVLGTANYVFDDWDPAATLAIVTQADIDAFNARVESRILTTLASFPQGNLQSPETWAAINRAITASVTPLIEAVSSVARDRRAAFQTAYIDLITGLAPSSNLVANLTGNPNADQPPPPTAEAGPDGNLGADSPNIDTANDSDVLANAGPGGGGGGPLGAVVFAAAGGGDESGSGFDSNAQFSTVDGAGETLGFDVDLDVDPDPVIAPPADAVAFASTALPAPVIGGAGGGPLAFRPLSLAAPLDEPEGDPAGGPGGVPEATVPAPDSDSTPLTLAPILFGRPGQSRGDDEPAAARPQPAVRAPLAPSAGLPGGAAGPIPPGAGPSLPAGPAGLSDPAIALSSTGNLPGWDGRVGGDGRAGLPRPVEQIMIPTSLASAYHSPGFWPAGTYGPSQTQFAGSPVGYGTAGAFGASLGGRGDDSRLRDRPGARGPAGRLGAAIPNPFRIGGGDPSRIGGGDPSRIGGGDPSRIGGGDRSRAGGGDRSRAGGGGGYRSGGYTGGRREGRDDEVGGSQELSRGRVVPEEGEESWSPSLPGGPTDGVVAPPDDEAVDTFASVTAQVMPMLVGAARRRDEDDDEYRDQPRRGLADGVVDGDRDGERDGGE